MSATFTLRAGEGRSSTADGNASLLFTCVAIGIDSVTERAHRYHMGRDILIGLAIVLLLCVDGWGCAGSPDARDAWCDTHQCDLTPLALAPVTGGDNITPSAVRWLSTGSGLDIIEDAYGVPVAFVPEVTFEGSESSCGATRNTFFKGELISSEIQIAFPAPDGCSPAWVTLMHEAIHSFCPSAHHMPSGVFAEHADSASRIDSATAAMLRDCVTR